jgi:hypothetical protein
MPESTPFGIFTASPKLVSLAKSEYLLIVLHHEKGVPAKISSPHRGC